MAPGQDGDPELERQRAEIEDAFRGRWVPPHAGKPQVLTERACAEARRALAGGRRTWLDQTIIEAVRDGAQPGDPLPPRRPGTYLDRGTDTEVIIIGRGPGRRVAVEFSHEDFPYARFGHRFEPAPSGGRRQAAQLVEQIEAGALHQMMDNPPPADSASIFWTTWGTPNSDAELDHQRAQIEDAFRLGWRPAGDGRPRVLTERAYAEARKVLGHGGWTGLDQAAIQAVRNGSRPGDPLPPLQPRPFIARVTDAEVILTGRGPGRCVAVLFCHEDFPGTRFGHRFPLEPYGEGHEKIWLMEELDTALHHRPRAPACRLLPGMHARLGRPAPVHPAGPAARPWRMAPAARPWQANQGLHQGIERPSRSTGATDGNHRRESRGVACANMDVLFIASVAVVAADPPQSRKLFMNALGLPLEGEGEGYYSSGSIPGSKHFGIWPLAEAAQACFGTPEWPAGRVVPQASIEFEVADADAVAAAGDELQRAGYEMLHPARTEPWGQTVARLLTEDGLIVGISYAPMLHGGGPA